MCASGVFRPETAQFEVQGTLTECIFFGKNRRSTNAKLLVWVPVVWDSKGALKNPNPFHKAIPGIQSTGPQTNNQPLAEQMFQFWSPIPVWNPN